MILLAELWKLVLERRQKIVFLQAEYRTWCAMVDDVRALALVRMHTFSHHGTFQVKALEESGVVLELAVLAIPVSLVGKTSCSVKLQDSGK